MPKRRTAELVDDIAPVEANDSSATTTTSTASPISTKQQRNQYDCGMVDCAKSFLSRAGRARHRREHHPGVQFDNPKGGRFACGHCSCVLPSCTDLCAHLCETHGEPAQIKTLRFRTLDEFRQWFAELQSRTGERFVQRKANKLLRDYYLSSLMCRHSGYLRERPTVSNGLRKRTKRGCSRKMQSHCSAFMDIYIYKNGDVQVVCCLHHYGHDADDQQMSTEDFVSCDLDEETFAFYANDDGMQTELVEEEVIVDCEGIGDDIIVEESNHNHQLVDDVDIRQQQQIRSRRLLNSNRQQFIRSNATTADGDSVWLTIDDDGNATPSAILVTVDNCDLVGQQREYVIDSSSMSNIPNSIEILKSDANPDIWYRNVCSTLQAIRESASLCRNDDISRQQIGYAIDQLWNNCEQMRIDQCNRINAQTQSSGATNDYVS